MALGCSRYTIVIPSGTLNRLHFFAPIIVALIAIAYIEYLERHAMDQMDSVVLRLYDEGLITPSSPHYKKAVLPVLQRHRPAEAKAGGESGRWINPSALTRDEATQAKAAPQKKRAVGAIFGGLGEDNGKGAVAAAEAPSETAAAVYRAPKPQIFDVSEVGKRAAAMVSSGGGSGAISAQGGQQPPPPPGVAWPPITLPATCFSGLGYNKTADAECYWTMDAVFQQERALEPDYPYCWGRSTAASDAVAASSPPPLLFHTILVSPTVLPTLPLLYWSFLATQCCDAQLWLWTAPPMMTNATASLATSGLPAGYAERIVLKELDLQREWAQARQHYTATDPGADEAAAALSSLAGPPGLTDWAKLLLLSTYGGMYIDVDTILLRDWRPLFSVPHLSYRAGFNIFMAGSVLRLAAAPDALTLRIVSAVLAGQDPSPLFISSNDTAVGLSRLAEPGQLRLLSEAMFDMTWYR